MSDAIHSPKRLLVETARQHIRDLNSNIVTETCDQGKCKARWDTEGDQPVDVKRHKAQMENYNAVITELKRKLADWEQALSHALDLLEQE